MILTMNQMEEVSVEPTTDASLPAYSHSMLNAISTCPVAGLVTYVSNKVMGTSKRAMPLEAGSAAHECYAAARLWQIGRVQSLRDHEKHHGDRLFGPERYESMCLAADEAGDDQRVAMLRFCLEAFYTSGFYDDPSDTRRTFTNIEEALIAYLDRFDFTRNVWVQDDPTAMVGIEMPIDYTITYVFSARKSDAYGVGQLFLPEGSQTPKARLRVRFVGTADGLNWRNDSLRMQENKTASRLGEAWATSFHTSHQVTGYMMGLRVQYALDVNSTEVHGMCIPLPRSYDAGGLMTENVKRLPAQYKAFLGWVLHNLLMIDAFKDNPLDAPQYTGACNKYFRACSLIPLCASDDEDKQDFLDQMVEREPSPTEKAMEDGT